MKIWGLLNTNVIFLIIYINEKSAYFVKNKKNN